MAEIYYIQDVAFQCTENPITTGNGKHPREMPFRGEILGSRSGPRITGTIMNAGTGAGTSTDIQIRNITQGRDYFTTLNSFEVDDKDANNRAILTKGVLGPNPSFQAGDQLTPDIDAIPGGSDSAEAFLYLTCGFWREVD